MIGIPVNHTGSVISSHAEAANESPHIPLALLPA